MAAFDIGMGSVSMRCRQIGRSAWVLDHCVVIACCNSFLRVCARGVIGVSLWSLIRLANGIFGHRSLLFLLFLPERIAATVPVASSTRRLFFLLPTFIFDLGYRPFTPCVLVIAGSRGIVNTVAGGGSFLISLPALLLSRERQANWFLRIHEPNGFEPGKKSGRVI